MQKKKQLKLKGFSLNIMTVDLFVILSTWLKVSFWSDVQRIPALTLNLRTACDENREMFENNNIMKTCSHF